MLYNAAKLTDTWQRPNIMDGTNTTAEKIKASAAEAAGSADQLINESVGVFQQFLGRLSEAISSDFDEGHWCGSAALLDAKKSGRGNVPWQRLVYIARQHGWQMGDIETLGIINELLSMNTRYEMSLADPAKSFDHRNH